MDEEKINAFVDDLKAVCRKHEMFLRGTCRSEGIYGEILIGDSRDPDSSGWELSFPACDIDYKNTSIDGIA